jgi:hypothetical protein
MVALASLLLTLFQTLSYLVARLIFLKLYSDYIILLSRNRQQFSISSQQCSILLCKHSRHSMPWLQPKFSALSPSGLLCQTGMFTIPQCALVPTSLVFVLFNWFLSLCNFPYTHHCLSELCPTSSSHQIPLRALVCSSQWEGMLLTLCTYLLFETFYLDL